MKEVYFSFSFLLVLLPQSFSQSKTVVTYNTALTPLFDTSGREIKAKTDEIIQALITLDADVYCLQEVWFHIVAEYITENMNATHPYSFSALHTDSRTMSAWTRSGKPPCQEMYGFVSFYSCMAECSNNATSSSELVECSTERCGLLKLPEDCITCLSTHNNAIKCAVRSTAIMNRPGLLMLSKYDIQNASVNYFHPDRKVLVPNAYIQSDIDGLGRTMCAHLAANLGSVYLEKGLMDKFTSYEEQNAYQVEKLVNLTESSPQVTLMGSLNTGPEVPNTGISEEFPKAYEDLTKAHFTNAFVDQVGTCTYCSKNVYVTSNRSTIVDHIMTKGLTTTAPQIVLSQSPVTQNMVLSVNNPMSDHAGVMVTIG